MENRQMLIIRNLPNELSESEKEEFLHYFGASSVKVIPSTKKNTCCAYAKFDSETKAKAVLFRLHQLEVLGTRLNVEFAKENVSVADPRIDKVATKEKDTDKYLSDFKFQLNAWNSRLNFNQPPPPHLKYAYPKANMVTINNIAHALMLVPKFYTQVLHLMNRMNLPPPFADPESDVENVHEKIEVDNAQESQPIGESMDVAPQSTEEESELETDSDDKPHDQDPIPVKRKKLSKIKRPKFIKPNLNEQIRDRNARATDDVFETQTLFSQKIKVKVHSECIEDIQAKNRVDETAPEKFGEIQPTNAISDVDVMKANRIHEYEHLPAFKNYHAGVPNCRLYIKNLSKTVTEQDLLDVFGQYREKADDEKSTFDIRLMQEGRMKGQAFVTLQSIELAQRALKDTNGYLLKDKPMVVVFAKSTIKSS